MRIVVLDSGNTSSYHVMRTVARAGHEAHVVSSEECISFRSKYCARAIRSPDSTDEPSFASFLLDLVQTVRYDLLLFCGDTEAKIVHEHRDRLERYVQCYLPEPRFREVAFSKNAAYRHAACIGIPIPVTCFPESPGQLAEVVGRLGYPLVVKGEHGSAGAHVRYAIGSEDLAAKYQEITDLEKATGGRPSIQEYIPGSGYVVHGLFRHGVPMALCSHRKDREYPIGRGVTSAATTVRHPSLDRLALKMLGSLRWHGLAKLDFKFDARDRQFKFIELDPRVSASIDVTRVAGADQVRMLCDLAAGKRVAPQLRYRDAVRYRWLFPREILNLVAEPSLLPSFVREVFRKDSYYDLTLEDRGPTLRALRVCLWFVRQQLKTRELWSQRRQLEQLNGLLATRAVGVESRFESRGL